MSDIQNNLIAAMKENITEKNMLLLKLADDNAHMADILRILLAGGFVPKKHRLTLHELLSRVTALSLPELVDKGK